MKWVWHILLYFLPFTAFAQKEILNLYAWTGEIPNQVIQQFEKKTGIKVNFSTYENNEMLYAKLRTTKQSDYDLIMPSGYFVDRMRRQNMLEKIDKKRLSHWNNIHPAFRNPAYDPNTHYSVPFIWGVTGIVVNQRYYSPLRIKKWSDLWDKQFKNQLMLLDDVREAFSIALLTMGYSVNDRDPKHLQAAFIKLKELMKNVKVFSTDTVVSIMIDEDATIGMAWNGDAFKASQENANIKFNFPKEGFIIWIDNFAIPRTAAHKDNAYAFINFILQPEIAKTIALRTNYPTANIAAQKILPPAIRDNPIIYPPEEILRRGQFQTDLGEDTLALLEKYWEELKMG
ncbi:MAG: spermidine/putrescine ABC transporter substrate-binding protein [Gammaproteobacteria bacterium RIFCSPHIGHO2_12_FULL_37_34]|nr:MAG: spermidine/putrescine ABC transporter substrate-binding protein [Gammaproteobacteria bacterium RIFCSPHIGHO2_12_FULL_37_34]